PRRFPYTTLFRSEEEFLAKHAKLAKVGGDKKTFFLNQRESRCASPGQDTAGSGGSVQRCAERSRLTFSPLPRRSRFANSASLFSPMQISIASAVKSRAITPSQTMSATRPLAAAALPR